MIKIQDDFVLTEQVTMKKTKIRLTTLAVFLLLFVLTLGLAVGSVIPAKKASAATYKSTEIFSAGTGGTVAASEKNADGDSYVQFAFSNEGVVNYRRNLALKWHERDKSADKTDDETDDETGDETEGGEEATEPSLSGVLKYLSFGFSFGDINFSRFSLVFESAEENISKDGTSKNSVVFKNADGVISVAVKGSSDQDNEEWEKSAEFTEINVSDGVNFRIDEEDCTIGEFAVYINETFVGKLSNIGGYYLEYLSSASSTPRVPVAFVADELQEGKNEQIVLVKELNGQSFKLNDDGLVVDNAAPVLVLNETVYEFTLGKKWSLSPVAIDVCDSSVTISRYYYMLKKDDEGVYVKGEAKDYKTLTTSTFFMPADDSGEQEQYVSVRFQLTDDAGIKDDVDSYVYLSWYAAESAVVTKGEGENAFDYILVNRNEEGPYYIGVTANDETKGNEASDEATEAAEAYQQAVTEAAKDLSAGNGSYFYLPSLRRLIGSDHADYRNLKFNVYYYKQSQAVGDSASSATSLSYNGLKFEINEKGKYLFCVLATDASSNSMMYYVDGELVSVSSTNIWDIEEIPKFSFEVSYSGATVEDPGEQSLGYRDSKYSVSSFEIVALPGYEAEYTLYFLDEDAMQSANIEKPFDSYSDLVEKIGEYYDQLKDYLIPIGEYNSDVKKDDDAWERTDNDYYWYPDSLTFVPVKVGYYVVQLTLTEAALPGSVVNSYQVIDVRNPIDSPPDSTYWLENNIVSVVLFSISAILAIIIVILFVVKPSDKNVDEVDLEKLKKIEGRKKAVLGDKTAQKDKAEETDKTDEE